MQLALLELNGAQLHWLDAAVQPSAELQLEGIDLRLKQLRWPVEADATLSLDAHLSAAGKASGQLHAEGTLTDQQAKIALRPATSIWPPPRPTCARTCGPRPARA